MQLEHHFTVPVPAVQAWEALLDVERIAPCMPGATVDSFDGETIEGKVKVKVGPIQVAYAGTARFVDKDAAAHRAVIEASARESRGAGTAAATITAVLDDAGSSTDVTVTTDLQITGKPAQFGRGVLADVGDKILGKFADCLAEELARDAPTATQDSESAPVSSLRPAPVEDTVDLLHSAGPAVLKRVAPLVGGLILVLIIWRLVVRRRG